MAAFLLFTRFKLILIFINKNLDFTIFLFKFKYNLLVRMIPVSSDINEVIKAIAKATNIYDIFQSSENSYDLSDWKSIYKQLALTLHPDRCSHPKATDAIAKVNNVRNEFIDGRVVDEDGCKITYMPDGDITLTFTDAKLASVNYANWKHLIDCKDTILNKYIPSNYTLKDNVIKYKSSERIIPISRVDIWPQKHVNWIISRVLEFSSFLDKHKFVHAGITPDSIFVVPKTHGIKVLTYHHMNYTDSKLKTVSGKYMRYYPTKLFSTKKAINSIDLHLTKALAAHMLGDTSGIGTKLIKTHNIDYINYIKHSHPEDCYIFAAYEEYRAMLKKNFKDEFHSLFI